MYNIIKILLLSFISINALAQGFTSNTVTGNLRIINGVLDLGDLASDPSTFGNGQMYYNTTTGKYRCKEAGVAANCISSAAVGYIYSSTAGGFIAVDATYFVTGTPQTRYVDPTSGSNTLCDGKGSGPSPTLPCAWASIQRALDDIPDGRTVNVLIKHSAATVSGTQIFSLYSQPGNNTGVTIEGDCTTPQAVLTTTGTGTALTTNGVTRLSQFTYVPTVSSGSIPATITEGEFRLRRNSATAATLNFPLTTAMSSSTTPNITAINTSTAALTTASICPWATIYSGSVTVGATSTQSNGTAQLNINGIKFTSSLSLTNTSMAGIHSASTGINPTITNGSVGSSYFTGSLVTVRGTLNNATTFTSLFNGAYLNILGRSVITSIALKGAISGSLGPGRIQVGGIIASGGSGIGWGGASIDGITNVDIETTAGNIVSGIYLDNAKLNTRASGAGCATFAGIAFDLQAGTEGLQGPIHLVNGSTYVACGTVTGKVSTSNIVIGGSKAFANSMWTGVTNIVTAASNWKVGSLAVVAEASLPVVDYGNQSFASNTDNGPSVIPVSQGGTGSATGSFYSSTIQDFIDLDTSYFVAATPVIRYVNPTTGSDTLCDGKGSGASPTIPCAWASVQRALDDVPDGFVAQVDVHIAAGTYATTQVWNMHAIPGSGGTVSNAFVRVRGNCSTPTAVFSTMGTGTAVVSVAGGGQTGGVTKKNQFTFAPTITSGSITGVAEGTHFLASDYSAGVSTTINPVRTSTSPNLVVVGTGGTITGVRNLCPYNTTFSALTITGPVNVANKAITASALQISGIEITNNTIQLGVNFIGIKHSGTAPSLRDCNLQSSVVTNLMSIQSTRPTGSPITGNLFRNGLEIAGQPGQITGVFASSSSANCLWLNGGIGFINTTDNGGISALAFADFEGTCTGIAVRNSSIGLVNGTGGVTMDITGRFMKLENSSSFITISAETVTGKRTLANQILSGSSLITASTWSDVNVSVAGEDLLVGGLPVASYASLTATPLMDVGSGSSASIDGIGPTSVTVTQGGTGTTTAFTPGSVVFAGTSGVYSQNNANLFWDNSLNNFGIGTAAPDNKLSVSQTSTVTSGSVFMQNNQMTATPSGSSTTTNVAALNQVVLTGSQNSHSIVSYYSSSENSATAGTLNEQHGTRYDVISQTGGTATTTLATAVHAKIHMLGSGTWNVTTAKMLNVMKPILGSGTLSGTNLYGLYIEDFSTPGGTWTNKYSVYSEGGLNYYGGNVGVGDTTPASALTVGSGDLFQVNSSGAIAAATGIISSGTINFSTLTASKGVFTDGSENLTSTGTLGTDQGGTGGTYPITLTSIPLTGTLAISTLNALILPARSFTVTAQRINVSVAGNTGSTNVVLRVSDGSNNCDASFACNATAGAKRPTLSGTCAFSSSTTLTMSVNSIGDCVTPPVILGVLDIEGNWP